MIALDKHQEKNACCKKFGDELEYKAERQRRFVGQKNLQQEEKFEKNFE